MARVNDDYAKLPAEFLFHEISRRIRVYQEAHPNARVLRMGIGDVTEPLVPTIVSAMRAAVDELGSRETFHGYAPERGYNFLVDAIREHDYRPRGIELDADEIFISDGSKSDTVNMPEIFAHDAKIAIVDPVYPVYVESIVMAGRTGDAAKDGRYSGLVYLIGTEANDFLPEPPEKRVDIVYLCSPNNPTGSALTRKQLERWVAWARRNDAVILFDAAYESYISDPALPHSIFEIPGARECAVEFQSFSKRAGFTGVRCAFVVVPKTVTGVNRNGERVSLNTLWARRHIAKFNGASYDAQRAAAAAYSEQGRAETNAQIAFYMENARLMREELSAAGLTDYGGVHAPYLWLRTPNNMSSWDFFDKLLSEAQIVGTPGAGFGPAGEGFFRLSAYNSRANVEEALARIRKVFG
jgi:LL-diaminopimelate aminotransferase